MASPQPEQAPAQAAGQPKRLDPRIWLLAIGTFAVGTDNLVIAGILPMLADDLNVGIDAAGRLVTAYALAYGLGSPILAAVAGRWKRERTVIWAIGGFAVANLLCAVAPNYEILIASRVVAGLAAAVYTPGSYALAISLAPPERRGRALSRVLLGISTSTVIGVPLGTIIGHRLGWHWTFLSIALISGAAMITLRAVRIKSPDAGLGAATTVMERLAPLTRPVILLALLPNLIWGMGTTSVFTYISPILLGADVGRDAIVILLLVNGVGGLIGSIAAGRIADRFGSIRPLQVAYAVVAINFLVWSFTLGNVVLTAIAMFVWSMGGWSMGAPQQSRIVKLDPPNAGVTLAINNATFYFGSALGAAIGGLLTGVMPPADLIYVGMGFALAGFGAVRLSVWAARRLPPQVTAATNP